MQDNARVCKHGRTAQEWKLAETAVDGRSMDFSRHLTFTGSMVLRTIR
jgi:hypothetical protein